MKTEFYTLQDAVEVLTDLNKDSSNSYRDKIKMDLNTAALILADKGFSVTSHERESLTTFIAELNSNANFHKPVLSGGITVIHPVNADSILGDALAGMNVRSQQDEIQLSIKDKLNFEELSNNLKQNIHDLERLLGERAPLSNFRIKNIAIHAHNKLLITHFGGARNEI